MRETILFAPGANGTELLRSLARFGVNMLGCRVCGAVDLARAVLQTHGFAITQTFLPRKDEPAVIDSFLREIPYFSNASYADAESMAAALYTLRSLIPAEEKETLRTKLPEGEFPEKNLAILQVYERYIQELRVTGRIDTIGLVRKAIGLGKTLDPEILILKEYPLSPLEKELAQRLSDGTFRETNLAGLFQKPAFTPTV
ncbi:MAG: hypothetical protein IJ061_06745, partial [Lachnospiraceae bacterium]|nr:hypothetical protein [Lachnospiraceae bacterium]